MIEKSFFSAQVLGASACIKSLEKTLLPREIHGFYKITADRLRETLADLFSFIGITNCYFDTGSILYSAYPHGVCVQIQSDQILLFTQFDPTFSHPDQIILQRERDMI